MWGKEKKRKREMGCASSKGSVEAAAPGSFAVFDINSIEEPWVRKVVEEVAEEEEEEKVGVAVPGAILQKLKMLEEKEAPESWAELSKALEELKSSSVVVKAESNNNKKKNKREESWFHTVEELEAKLKGKPESEGKKEELEGGGGGGVMIKGKAVRENIFIVRDRMEREKEGKNEGVSEYPEKCPPGGEEKVVIYTTSLGGVRKTLEECKRVKEVLEGHRVVYDERDVSLHAQFLKQLKDLLTEEPVVALPRVFVKGRYVGGAQDLLQLNESGRLSRILYATRVERGIGRLACHGCGGARFIPCFHCRGSCRLTHTRCPHCNENGLLHCPACLSI